MRGSPERASIDAFVNGIIPAHAGLTRQRLWCVAAGRDHPRACGAHTGSSCIGSTSPGSSPRMRGSPMKALHSVTSIGIIPAHAGLTASSTDNSLSSWDHPRACGAHNSSRYERSVTKGSSPRMRGSQFYYPKFQNIVGIIPAHAGLTDGPRFYADAVRDHPRACGAHVALNTIFATGMGSSPRMRGSLGDCLEDVLAAGIIPAHAGLTHRPNCGNRLRRDHPRACGAHLMGGIPQLYLSGSSPRMRGSPSSISVPIVRTGIIPAHAGLTWQRAAV